jgi:hypothetical protein
MYINIYICMDMYLQGSIPLSLCVYIYMYIKRLYVYIYIYLYYDLTKTRLMHPNKSLFIQSFDHLPMVAAIQNLTHKN